MPVYFDLHRIQTVQFAISDECVQATDKVDLTTSLRFGVNKEKRMVAVFSKFQFIKEHIPFIQIELMCEFEIKEESWACISDSTTPKIVLPKNTVQHLTMLTIGTTRGALHTKTEGTCFNHFKIPLIDVSRILTSDVEIEE